MSYSGAVDQEDSTGRDPLDLDFTGQEPLPDSAIERANELMASGKLFRYGESSSGEADAALLEAEFAQLVGRRYCVALNSCGASMAVALMAAGVTRDDPVMMNAFTLAPVPGAIAHSGAKAVFVGIDDNYHIDLDDLRRATTETGSTWLLLSYMRGHIPNLSRVFEVCDQFGITVIEDCAHTMGASWDNRPTGTFGIAGCFSTQSFKHANSGEGGLLVTDDEDLAAKAILLSGSYMHYAQHGAAPPAEVFERHRLTTPNLSMRMSALAAALVRPQLALLPERAMVWNERYAQLASQLAQIRGITVPDRDPKETYVASSIQFNLDHPDIAAVVEAAAASGVFLKWFGADQPRGFTSRFDHWRYADEQHLAHTRGVLDGLIDMRIPLAMTAAQADQIVSIVTRALAEATLT